MFGLIVFSIWCLDQKHCPESHKQRQGGRSQVFDAEQVFHWRGRTCGQVGRRKQNQQTRTNNICSRISTVSNCFLVCCTCRVHARVSFFAEIFPSLSFMDKIVICWSLMKQFFTINVSRKFYYTFFISSGWYIFHISWQST